MLISAKNGTELSGKWNKYTSMQSCANLHLDSNSGRSLKDTPRSSSTCCQVRIADVVSFGNSVEAFSLQKQHACIFITKYTLLVGSGG
jgi:hypothetical protein